MKSYQHRNATTLVEVIIVIGIIGVLFTLILSAVQQVRTASLRLACANNIRQLGLALQGYHNAVGSFPPGVSHPSGWPGVYGPNTDPYPLLSWEGRILPFLEQDALWNLTLQAYAQDSYSLNDPPHVGMEAFLPVFSCAADTRRSRPGVLLQNMEAPTSYLGVEGVNQFLNEGMFYMDSRTRLADVTDGASNTLLVGERPPSLNGSFGRWYGGWGQWGVGNSYLGGRNWEWTDISMLVPMALTISPQTVCKIPFARPSISGVCIRAASLPCRRWLRSFFTLCRRQRLARVGNPQWRRERQLAGLINGPLALNSAVRTLERRSVVTAFLIHTPRRLAYLRRLRASGLRRAARQELFATGIREPKQHFVDPRIFARPLRSVSKDGAAYLPGSKSHT